MTGRAKHIIDLWCNYQSLLGLLIIGLCCGLWSETVGSAEDEPAYESLQIQLTLNQLLGEQQAARYGKILKPGDMNSWVVHLPRNSSADIPGVMVYVSPMKTGRIDPRWREVMNEQNLIYIAANDSGNKTPTNRRMVLAVMAVKALALEHSFDTERIYVSGFSGGGRVASILASQYPAVFTGALYICGVDFWKKDKTPAIDRLLQNRFVFLTGSRDFNRDETRKIYRKYLKAGAQQSKLMVIPGLAHAHPDAAALTEALQFLNGVD